MKRLAFAFAVVSLALTGCGGSLCEDMADAATDFAVKAKPCSSEVTSPTFTDEEIKQCEESIDKTCTEPDKKALEAFVECIDKLPTCSTDNQNSFGLAALACVAEVEKVSEACGTTTSQSVTRQIASYSFSR